MKIKKKKEDCWFLLKKKTSFFNINLFVQNKFGVCVCTHCRTDIRQKSFLSSSLSLFGAPFSTHQRHRITTAYQVNECVCKNVHCTVKAFILILLANLFQIKYVVCVSECLCVKYMSFAWLSVCQPVLSFRNNNRMKSKFLCKKKKKKENVHRMFRRQLPVCVCKALTEEERTRTPESAVLWMSIKIIIMLCFCSTKHALTNHKIVSISLSVALVRLFHSNNYNLIMIENATIFLRSTWIT